MEISDAKLASALIRVKNYEISAIPGDNEIGHTFTSDFERKMDTLISSFDKKKTNNRRNTNQKGPRKVNHKKK